MRAILILCAGAVACHEGGDAGAARDSKAGDDRIGLELKVVEPQVKQGTVPAFELRVTNEGTAPVRILDTTKRRDLQFTYYKLVMTRGGAPVDVPIRIADPGVLTDDVYVDLAPGATHVASLREFAELYEKLAPGEYQAHVLFWRDPLAPPETRQPSNRVSFTVVP